MNRLRLPLSIALSIVAVGASAAPALAADTAPPSQPAAVTQSTPAVTGSTWSLTFSWQASTDDVAVDHYEISRGGTVLGTTTATTYTDATVPLAGGTYAYSVVAVDAAGNKSSAAVFGYRFADASPPVAPGAIKVRVGKLAVGKAQVVVSWSAADVSASDDDSIFGLRGRSIGKTFGGGSSSRSTTTYELHRIDLATNVDTKLYSGRSTKATTVVPASAKYRFTVTVKNEYGTSAPSSLDYALPQEVLDALPVDPATVTVTPTAANTVAAVRAARGLPVAITTPGPTTVGVSASISRADARRLIRLLRTSAPAPDGSGTGTTTTGDATAASDYGFGARSLAMPRWNRQVLLSAGSIRLRGAATKTVTLRLSRVVLRALTKITDPLSVKVRTIVSAPGARSVVKTTTVTIAP